ncbi:helix-turn-helix transcriptional regulator [Corynebacterium frankenforstense]|uniref:helix-turn-helix transcriptional regulator n=1 Tax=Corynebacterium frankenforstense TaxID=1230998 RepID=UPI00254ADB2B|nr:helix-turn-helix transcriptional regulator [Corynebacterium frankenforstense]MDK6260284.1 helix-turn-helix transcriptional regulator [Corynebacterium frankenforstense]
MSPRKRAERPIYNRMRMLRAERDMTRAQLAELIEVNPQTVGALERGDHYPSLDLAFRICEVFDLPVEAVFSRKEFSYLSHDVYGR